MRSARMAMTAVALCAALLASGATAASAASKPPYNLNFCATGIGCLTWRADGDRLVAGDTVRNGRSVVVIARWSSYRGYQVRNTCWDTSGAGGRWHLCHWDVREGATISFSICNGDKSEQWIDDCVVTHARA